MSRPRLVTDAQILAATRASVLEHGPHVTLDVVAAKLGVSQPALHKRFGSRQELMLAALVPVGEPPWIREIADGPDDQPLRAQLEGLLRRVSASLEESLPALSALRESGLLREAVMKSMNPPPPVVAIRAVTQWLARGEARGLLASRGVELRSVSSALLGALMARIHVTHLLNQSLALGSHHEFLADLAELFTRALAPEPRPAGASTPRHA